MTNRNIVPVRFDPGGLPFNKEARLYFGENFMIWHLVALVIAGLGAGGIGYLLRRLSKQKLPAWIVPAFAAAGMLSYQINFEYSWLSHKKSQLPAGSVVVAVEEEQQPLRPWTYLHPLTVGMSVVDTKNIQQVEQPGENIKQFILYRFEREYVDRLDHQPHLLNCGTAELLPIDGKSAGQVRQIERDDELYRVVCQ